MAYTKQTFTAGQTLKASDLNTMSQGIKDLDDGKQAKLVSGSSIKTINGESLIGSGDIKTSAPSDEQVSDSVNAYLQMNPVSPYDDSAINGKIDALGEALDSFLASSNILVSEGEKLVKGYKWTNIKDFGAGVIEAGTTRCVLNTTVLEGATSLKIEVTGETWRYVYAIFDENNVLLASNVTGSSGFVWTTDTLDYIGNVKYLRIMFSKTNNGVVSDSDFETLAKDVSVTVNNPVMLDTKKDIEKAFGEIKTNSYKNTLRVMSYNVGAWAYGVGSNAGLADATYSEKLLNYKNYFGEVMPELCFLQEKVSVINKTSGDTANNVLMAPIFPYIFDDFAQVSTQSIYPLRSSEAITLTAGSRVQLKSYIKVGDKQICVLCCHLSSGGGEEYAALRAEQIAEVLALVQGEDYVIMGGDFNVQSLSEYSAFTDAGYKLVNGGYFPEKATTQGGIKPHDNIIVSPNIYVRNFHLDSDQYDKLASDHLPLWSDLVLT